MPARARSPRTRRRVALVVVAALAMVLVAASGESPTRILRHIDSTGYAADCLAVGAAANAPGRSDGPRLAMFRAANDVLGPLTVRRSFDSGLPESFDSSSAAHDPAAGLHSFVSWKPPGGDFRGAAAGAYDDRVRAWARSVPRTGVYATAFHEPENNMTGPEFVALQRHLYEVVKEANPTIQWGPVYMAYWWDPQQPGHWIGDPGQWWPGEDSADFVGFDYYAPDPAPMTRSGSFATWYAFAEPTGLPLLIAEYGQYRRSPGGPSDFATAQARAAAIREDAQWIREHPRIGMWIYWQGADAEGDWRLQDEASRQARREVAESGCGVAPRAGGATAAPLAEAD